MLLGKRALFVYLGETKWSIYPLLINMALCYFIFFICHIDISVSINNDFVYFVVEIPCFGILTSKLKP